jgi:hypothetical protein
MNPGLHFLVSIDDLRNSKYPSFKNYRTPKNYKIKELIDFPFGRSIPLNSLLWSEYPHEEESSGIGFDLDHRSL